MADNVPQSNVSQFPGAELERCGKCNGLLCLHAVYGPQGMTHDKRCHACDGNRTSKLDAILRHRE